MKEAIKNLKMEKGLNNLVLIKKFKFILKKILSKFLDQN